MSGLTAEDGYQAQRSYSLASEPESARLMLTVELIEGGEVSPYLTSDVRPGDKFELRGPIGGYFVWTIAMGGPLFLVAGGSGIAPLIAMLRHRAAAKSKTPALLLYSSRTFEDIIYRDELDQMAARNDGLTLVYTLTRWQPPGWTGGSRRIDRSMLATVGVPAKARPKIFICGPTSLVEIDRPIFVRARPRAQLDQDGTFRAHGRLSLAGAKTWIIGKKLAFRSTETPLLGFWVNFLPST